jgi:hypothetical protein
MKNEPNNFSCPPPTQTDRFVWITGSTVKTSALPIIDGRKLLWTADWWKCVGVYVSEVTPRTWWGTGWEEVSVLVLPLLCFLWEFQSGRFSGLFGIVVLGFATAKVAVWWAIMIDPSAGAASAYKLRYEKALKIVRKYKNQYQFEAEVGKELSKR